MVSFKKLVQNVFQAPSEALADAISLARTEERAVANKRPFRLAQEYFNTLGPGLTTGAADDDPSGIGTYSQQGAAYGFQLLWLSLFTFPFMAIVQEMCARIGIVSGHGLASNIRARYSVKVLYAVCALLFVANTLNIAADLGAMAAATTLLIPGLNFLLLAVLYAVGIMLLQIFTTYARYAKILKWLSLALLAYVFTAFAVHLDWGEALYHTVVPSLTFSKNQIFLLCAILGTTISPYLFFWQTSQEVEEHHHSHDAEHMGEHGGHDFVQLRGEIRKMRIDVWSGMFVSNAVMFFIVAACAATLFTAGITNIQSASQAALAIRPFGGELTFFFFAVGIVGTGLLAIPTLAGSSAYAIAESFGWKRGLYYKLSQARAFYGVIIISMLIAVVANAAHLDPIKGLIYSAVANGIIAPIILFFIVHISSSMRHFKNHQFITFCGWFITALMALSGVAAIASLLV